MMNIDDNYLLLSDDMKADESNIHELERNFDVAEMLI